VWHCGNKHSNSIKDLELWNFFTTGAIYQLLTALCSQLDTPAWFPAAFTVPFVSSRHVRPPAFKFQLEPARCAVVIFLAADGRAFPWPEKLNWGLRDLQPIPGSGEVAQEWSLWAASEAACRLGLV
jgi:hypothetical protein